MLKTLEKTRKRIAKKKKGNLGSLHEGSRDSKRLHRALVRDEKLVKLAAVRRKQEQPLAERAAYFQERVVAKGNKVLQSDEIQEAVNSFVHQYDEELAALKRARRPGRPQSTREDLLNMKAAALEKEHQNGFLVPDVSSEDDVQLLARWEGSWAHLTSIRWVRITDAGAVRPATFPPNKD